MHSAKGVQYKSRYTEPNLGISDSPIVSKSLNFTDRAAPSNSEAKIEDLVVQAQRPNEVNSDPVMVSQWTASHLSHPEVNHETQGYLSPKLPRDVGKKTLVVDLDETIIHSWFK